MREAQPAALTQLLPPSVLIGDRGFSLSAAQAWCALAPLFFATQVAMPTPFVLGVAPDAAVDEIKRAYRRLSRELHPDRTGGDPGALRDFVRVAAAHEALTGEAHRPYDDLYSDVCLRIAGVCDDDADVDAAKEFFPRYDGSSKFPPTKKNTGPDHYDDLTGKKKKRRRKKAAKKEL